MRARHRAAAVASKASRRSTSRRIEGIPTVNEQPPSPRRRSDGRRAATVASKASRRSTPRGTSYLLGSSFCWGWTSSMPKARSEGGITWATGIAMVNFLASTARACATGCPRLSGSWKRGAAPRRSLGGGEACLEGSLRRARASSRLTTCRLSPCGVLQLPSGCIQSLPSPDCPARASRVPARSSCVLRWFRLPSCTSRPADLRASTGPPCCSWDKLPRPSDALQAAPHE